MKEQDPVHNPVEKSPSQAYQYNNIRGGAPSATMQKSTAFSGKGRKLGDYDG